MEHITLSALAKSAHPFRPGRVRVSARLHADAPACAIAVRAVAGLQAVHTHYGQSTEPVRTEPQTRGVVRPGPSDSKGAYPRQRGRLGKSTAVVPSRVRTSPRTPRGYRNSRVFRVARATRRGRVPREHPRPYEAGVGCGAVDVSAQRVVHSRRAQSSNSDQTVAVDRNIPLSA